PVPLPPLEPPAPDEFAPEAPPPDGVCAGLSASAAVPRAAMPAATAAALAAFLATCVTFDVRVLRAAVFFAPPRAAFFLPAPRAADLFAVFFDRTLASVLAAADFDFDLAPPRFALRPRADDFAFFLAVFAMSPSS